MSSFSARRCGASRFPPFTGAGEGARTLFHDHTVSFFRGDTQVDARGDIEICLTGRFTPIGGNRAVFNAITELEGVAYVASRGGGVQVLNTTDGTTVAVPGATLATNTYAHIAAGSTGRLFTLTTDGRLHVIAVSNGAITPFIGGAGVTWNDFAVSGNRRLIAAVRSTGGVDSLQTGRAVRAGTNRTIYRSCVFLSGNALLCSGGDGVGLERVDTGDGNRRVVDMNGHYIHMVNLGSDNIFAIRDDNIPGQLNPATGEFTRYAAMVPAVTDVTPHSDGRILAVADTGGSGFFDFTDCPTPADKIGGLVNLPVFRYDVMPTRSAGRYASGGRRTVVLTNPLISGAVSIMNGAPEDVDTLLRVSRFRQFWICALNLFPTGTNHVFPFKRVDGAPDIARYAQTAIWVTGADMRKAGPMKNLIEPGAVAEMRFSGHWASTRLLQPGV